MKPKIELVVISLNRPTIIPPVCVVNEVIDACNSDLACKAIKDELPSQHVPFYRQFIDRKRKRKR